MLFNKVAIFGDCIMNIQKKIVGRINEIKSNRKFRAGKNKDKILILIYFFKEEWSEVTIDWARHLENEG